MLPPGTYNRSPRLTLSQLLAAHELDPNAWHDANGHPWMGVYGGPHDASSYPRGPRRVVISNPRPRY